MSDAARKLALKGIGERAMQTDGQLDIETAPGKGTTVSMHIPLPLLQTKAVQRPLAAANDP